MAVAKTSSPLGIFYSLVLLAAGLVWIWASRAAPGTTTAGSIPAPRQGFLAPDFRLATERGDIFHLSGQRGHPVLVNFWASWCSPCREEMPALERVYADYQSRGLEILAVNVTFQDDRSAARDFAQSYGLTFPVLLDLEGTASKQYLTTSLPTSFFIDRQGIIQEVVVGGPMSEALLRIRIENLFQQSRQEAP